MAVQKHDPLALANVRIHGRTLAQSPLNLFWTGSGVEFDLRGSELSIEIEADFRDLEPWVCVLINDHLVYRVPLQKGVHTLPLFRGLNLDSPHNIKILRESQAMPEDALTCVKLHAISFDGELAQLPTPTSRLEFLGDSLSSGEGSMGGPADAEWRPIWFSASCNYTRLTAQMLGGESRALTQSGWGVRSSWDNDPKCNIPAYYEKICGVVPEGAKGACHLPNDFLAWKPDMVICALGSNDRNAMGHAQRVDPETGIAFAQRRDDPKPLEDDMLAFLQKLRRLNPDAYIAWMFFEGEEVILPVIRRAMARFEQGGDKKSGLLLVPPMRPTGARNHPGADVHLTTAQALAPQIAKILCLAANQEDERAKA